MMLRVAAAVVLTLQLSQLGLPALCPTARATSPGTCPEEMPQHGSRSIDLATSQAGTCASAALCAVIPAAFPAPAAVAVALPSVTGPRVQGSPPLVDADPSAPLSPPPERLSSPA
jgi:hypothetical protein